MSGSELIILFYATLAGLATIIGVWLMERKQHWAVDNSHYINSFAAGLILALAFFHLIPEAAELAELSAFLAIFIGFFVFFLLENVFVLHSGAEIHFCLEEDEEESKHVMKARTGFMAFSGLAFHSLVDGIIIGVGFEIDPMVGLLTSLAVIMHELPEGITSFALMRMSGMDLKRSRSLSIIIGIATPLGALISLLFLQTLTEPVIGILLALAAGTFLYVAASDLIPETHESNNRKNVVAFVIGSAFIFLITMLF
ncbi:MAG: ZIP family metal transporter [Candidatus Hermodarchaeota archaeon]